VTEEVEERGEGGGGAEGSRDARGDGLSAGGILDRCGEQDQIRIRLFGAIGVEIGDLPDIGQHRDVRVFPHTRPGGRFVTVCFGAQECLHSDCGGGLPFIGNFSQPIFGNSGFGLSALERFTLPDNAAENVVADLCHLERFMLRIVGNRFEATRFCLIALNRHAILFVLDQV